MIVVNHKAKQYLIIALKVFILTITFGYIYNKLTQNESIRLGNYFHSKITSDASNILSLLFFLSLALLNWFFEILKWKTLVSEIQQLSFLTAMKQSLASLTVSLTTPNRIGEYGAKAYFFTKNKRKHILLLNFFSNGIQMGVTIFFGIIGMIIVFQNYELPFSILNLSIGLLLIGFLLIIGFRFKKQQLVFKGLTISNVFLKFKKLSFQIKLKTIGYSVFRYASFSMLFYFLLLFFNAEIALLQFIPLLATMYLITSIIPTIFIFDVIVKGGAAVWLFSLVGISEIPVLCTVLSMWILNFLIPSMVGAVYLFTYKTEIG